MKDTFILYIFDIADVDIFLLYAWSKFTKFNFFKKLYAIYFGTDGIQDTHSQLIFSSQI
jgi:hypothetical protein